jgi:hypothetical protein
MSDCDFHPLVLGWPVAMELGSDDQAAAMLLSQSQCLLCSWVLAGS